MTFAAFVPRADHERKPSHGAPCTRCGLCCMATLCPLGRHAFKREDGPCPALVKDGDGYACGLATEPHRYFPARALVKGGAALAAAARWLIGGGTGCDARFNGEPINQEFYVTLRRWDVANRRAVQRARKLWGMP